eukprot:9780046-Alexandrium_andersonii.AAC.1
MQRDSRPQARLGRLNTALNRLLQVWTAACTCLAFVKEITRVEAAGSTTRPTPQHDRLEPRSSSCNYREVLDDM